MPNEKKEAEDQSTENTQTDTPTPDKPVEDAQKEHIADIIDDDFLPGEKPEDEPAKESDQAKVSDDQPDGETPAKEAKAEKKDKDSIKEPEQKTKDTEEGRTPEKEESAEGDEQAFDVELPEGSRKVGLKQLTTTYQQFANLQRIHQDLKPMLDIGRQYNIPPANLVSFLMYGIQRATEKETPPKKEEQPIGYAGPFANQEVDDYIKENDPEQWQLAHNLHKQNLEVHKRLEDLQKEVVGIRLEKEQISKNEQVENAIKLMDDFQALHADYFKVPGRVETFQNYFLSTYGREYYPKDINFLNSVLYAVDPDYVQKTFEEKVRTDIEKRKKEEKGAFGESGDVRTSTPASLRPESEQTQHIRDVLED